jgi:hypothetical protein
MKWLKLFETFRDDFYISVDDLETEYKSKRNKLFSDAKSKVDEFMFDLTDDFSDQKTNQQDFIEEEDLSVWYHLKCQREDFERFLELLKDTRERLIDELGLDIRLKIDAWVKADTNFGPGNINHSFCHGYLGRWDEMMRYIGEYSKVKPEYGLDQYSHFTITIQVY